MTEGEDKASLAEAFRTRTKKFVIDTIKFYRTLPKTKEAKIIAQGHKLNFIRNFQ